MRYLGYHNGIIDNWSRAIHSTFDWLGLQNERRIDTQHYAFSLLKPSD